ncbi:MAG: PP2C family protein-serine/threonine phosphatase [Candidatus Marinimicrobia bacterium]|jgi:serine phosphatase RsbU (regulator of sigma subunit)|nr:PP2C family protein-serine/threonine phosphatase [Candidatus Neomarinimicrobiota bacterium]MBT3617320.1 PP2C family protein-serine/threonine phosphatase [Candidatus Neomarinimicrobiota bacterium]MBT3828974.1 PP2C family protein-serine/threonine phosphatase [Candidatus Neomarinimicrobiota bacterium]MBT3997616.1 PP2C family protein-serine/threonine phosphatase [Candidatus Neomarinimicrobiota bacterium]MBT4281519.1 PP2C family protein-serine/threonine phosphatase [Candidatus Neomarinimicrobiota
MSENHQVRNLNALLEVAKALGGEMQLDNLLPIILQKTTEVMDADRSSLFIYDESTNELWSKVAEGLDEKEIRFPVGIGIAGDVAKTLKTANIIDAYDDDRFNPEFDKKTNYRTKSVLCMPMMNNEGNLVGVVQVLNKKDGESFGSQDENLLEALSVQAGVAIQRAQLLVAFVEKQRIQESLKLAADIQMGMLPKNFPAFPDRDDFDLFASIIPAKEVGGDFYDFFLIDEEHLCFVIGDVSGKGVPAALFMAVTKTHVAASTIPGVEPSDILFRANNDLSKDNDQGMFCTIFYGILNTKTGEVHYSNGGHNPPYIVREDGTNEQLDGTEGIALGVMGDMDFGVKTITLEKGDSMYLYTDGVNEAMDAGGNEYSYERLEEYLRSTAGKKSTEIVSGSLDDINSFVGSAEQSDDITVLMVKYTG